MPIVDKAPATSEPTKLPDRDTRNWIMVGLWGLMFATIFGEGLYAFVDNHWAWGSIYTAIGILGVIAVDQTARGKRLATLYPPEYRASATMVAAIVLLLTWVFVGYDILDRHFLHRPRSAGTAQIRVIPPSPELSKLRRENAELKQYKAAHEGDDWPTITPDKQGALFEAFKRYTPNSLTIVCNSAQCNALADQIALIAQNAGWFVKMLGYLPGVHEGLYFYQGFHNNGAPINVALAKALQEATGYSVSTDAVTGYSSNYGLAIGTKPRPQ
jgi:hypothetical protein